MPADAVVTGPGRQPGVPEQPHELGFAAGDSSRSAHHPGQLGPFRFCPSGAARLFRLGPGEPGHRRFLGPPLDGTEPVAALHVGAEG